MEHVTSQLRDTVCAEPGFRLPPNGGLELDELIPGHNAGLKETAQPGGQKGNEPEGETKPNDGNRQTHPTQRSHRRQQHTDCSHITPWYSYVEFVDLWFNKFKGIGVYSTTELHRAFQQG
jgi:hypothetical protein